MNLSSLTEAISSRFGLIPRPDSRDRLHLVVAEHAERHGLSVEDVIRRAAVEPAFARRLAEHCVVPETFFLRPPEHFAFLADELRKRSKRFALADKIRIWSAGCSTGQEPYSVAMTVEDSIGPESWSFVEILATDISDRALRQACRAVYGPWALRGVPGSTRNRFFDRAEEEDYSLRSDLLKRVSFHHLSIQEHLRAIGDRTIDFIFFQNVGVYLLPEALASIHQEFSRVLKNDGFLIQAVTDPRPEKRLFLAYAASGPPIYELAPREGQKKRVSITHAVDRQRPATTADKAPLPSGLPLLVQDHRVLVDDSIRAITGLAHDGRLDEALEAATALATGKPYHAAAFFLRAQLHLSTGRLQEAVADLRRVVFLAPDDRIGRYWYALALVEAGHVDLALGQLRRLTADLQALDPQTTLSDGLTSTKELSAAVEFLRKGIE